MLNSVRIDKNLNRWAKIKIIINLPELYNYTKIIKARKKQTEDHVHAMVFTLAIIFANIIYYDTTQAAGI